MALGLISPGDHKFLQADRRFPERYGLMKIEWPEAALINHLSWVHCRVQQQRRSSSLPAASYTGGRYRRSQVVKELSCILLPMRLWPVADQSSPGFDLPEIRDPRG